MSQTLEGQTALVTGASRGIGAAIARRLAHDGAQVIVHYGRGEAEARSVAAAIEAEGGRAWTVQADLSTTDGPQKLFEALPSQPLDILVNNAGVAEYLSIEDTDELRFDAQANVNMRSLFFITKHALARLRDGGRIVNISSAVSRTYFPGITAYAATKGFVDVLTLQLAGSLAPRRITVNAVAPGAIETRLAPWMNEPGGAEMLAQLQALPGFGQPEQIAGVVAFLAGPDGAWTTGQVVDASGGTKL